MMDGTCVGVMVYLAKWAAQSEGKSLITSILISAKAEKGTAY